jgi:hypothetical protein
MCGLVSWAEEGWKPFEDLERDLAPGAPGVRAD